MPREVRTGGHIGAGKRGQGIHQRLAIFVGGQITAIDQNIGVSIESCAPLTDGIFIVTQTVLTQPAASDLKTVFVTVTDQVHSIQITMTFQQFGHLRDAIALIIKHVNEIFSLCILLHALHEREIIGRIGIDDNQFKGSVRILIGDTGGMRQPCVLLVTGERLFG